ncbi:hypothetical protein N2152v2_001689 [Parachlorella kessleri]
MARLAQARPLAGLGLLLLVVGCLTFFHQGQAEQEVDGAGASQAVQGPRRARLLEVPSAAQLQQQALLEDADKLAAEVAGLAQELDALQDPGSLTLRERLWKEKEEAGDPKDEDGTSAASGSDGASSGSSSSSTCGEGKDCGDAGARPVPSRLQSLLLAREQVLGRAARQAQKGQQQEGDVAAAGEARVHDALAGWAGQRGQQQDSSGLPGQGLARFTGRAQPRPEPEVRVLTDEEVARRRGEVVEAMRHAWGGYVQYAWGHDELAPVSKKGKDGFGGLGATIIDSLDTLLMMGMREEYDRALEWITNEMVTDAAFDASVFETIIRVVGGFLAAYEVTGDEVLLRKSEEVAQRILPAYNTTTGIPYNTINLKTQVAKNPKWNLQASTLAEFGTHQLEFFKLSQKTGNNTYRQKAEATIRLLYERNPGQGLMPLFVNPKTGRWTNRKVSFGALGDSYYEYLIKLWVLKGRQPQDEWVREMWEQAMDEMIDRLVFTSKEGFMYIAEFDRASVKHKFDHLVCFVPGMLALGVHSGAVAGEKAKQYMQVAAGVTETCWQMYHTQPTGLSPEYIQFSAGGMRVGAPYNLLRPEALEAFWYMWRMTKDWKYRTWAWEVFQAFQTQCKTDAGYSGVKDVRKPNVTLDDTQQSFFLAETLKYLYLIYSPDEALDWDDWVLNTEAHPLRIVGSESRPKKQQQQQGSSEQKSRFGLSSLWRRKEA